MNRQTRWLWLLIALFLLISPLGCGLLDDEGWDDDNGYYQEDPPDDFWEDEDDWEAPIGPITDGEMGIFEVGECDYDDLDADVVCGYVNVPENYTDPDSALIQLAVTIVRSPGGARYADPVVYLEGGPGGSGTADVEGWLEQPFLADRDLILFDQRGTGWSWPSLNCYELEYASDDTDLEAAIACYERLRDEGIDLAQYNSAASAADLALMRQALGYNEWNLLSVSYGTRLALTVMRDAPQGIRSVILDSVYPPEVNAYEEEALNGLRTFELLFADCAADRACNAAFPNLAQTLYALLDALDANPVEFEVVDPWTDETFDVYLDGIELASALFQAFYDTDTIPWIPYAIDQIVQENYEEAWILLLGGEDAGDYRRRQGDDEDLTDSEGLFYSVECYEELPFNSLQEAAALEAGNRSPLLPYLRPETGSVFDVCEIWNVGRPPAVENQPVRSNIPTLVLAGQYDPVTPPAWALSAASYLPNSFYYEFPGVGHGVVETACGMQLIADFLNNPRTAPNAACIQQMGAPAFFTP